MSLQDAIEIKRREAALRPNLLQKLGAAAPLLFGAFLAYTLVAPLFSNKPASGVGAPCSQIALFLIIALIGTLFWQAQRHHRQIMRLEIELIKLRRDRPGAEAVDRQ